MKYITVKIPYLYVKWYSITWMETINLKMFTINPLNKQANNGEKMESYKYLVDSKKLEKKKQETTEKSKMIGLILNLPIIVLKCKQSKYAIEEVEIFR